MSIKQQIIGKMVRGCKKKQGSGKNARIKKAILEIGNDKAQTPAEFLCDYCGRSFTKKHNIVKHIRNYHTTTSCYCNICEQRFGSNARLQQHMNRGHNRYNQPNPECDLCGKIFTRRENIAPHLASMHSVGEVPSVSCKICNRKFTTDRNLKRHVSKLHNSYFENPTCDECNKVFRLKPSLIAHIQSAHNVSAKNINRCHLCEKVYCWSNNLRTHLETFHGEVIVPGFKCDLCPKAYTTNQSLRRHVRTVHNVEVPNEFTCDLCSEKFPEQTFLENHVSLHHRHDSPKVSGFTCECGKALDNEPALRQHIKADHPFDVFYSYCKNFLLRSGSARVAKIAKDSKNRNSRHNCETCFAHFGSLYDLRNHMKATHDVQLSLSTCNVCFSKFFSKAAMTQHQKVCVPPDDVNPCSQCEKLFTDKLSLSFHMKIFHPKADSTSPTNVEEAVDELKCEYCERVCKNNRTLKKHVEYTHLGMQRYKCLACESFFKEKRNLRKHIRIKHSHSPVFPLCHFCHKRFESAKACKEHLQQAHSYHTNTFPCEICASTFSCNDSLILHMKTKHTEEDELFKCEDCTLVFRGFETFEKHKEKCHGSLIGNAKNVPRCVICMKDFGAQTTLKRHIRRFHEGFNPAELAAFGYSRRLFVVECKDCLKSFADPDLNEYYLDHKQISEATIFKCDSCGTAYNALEFAIQRYKITTMSRKRKQLALDVSDDEDTKAEKVELDDHSQMLEEVQLDSASDAQSESSSVADIIRIEDDSQDVLCVS